MHIKVFLSDCDSRYLYLSTYPSLSLSLSLSLALSLSLSISLSVCNVDPATDRAELETSVSEIKQGEAVTYVCKSGTVHVSGDFNRGCGEDGQMTGQPLVCAGMSPGIQKVVDPF